VCKLATCEAILSLNSNSSLASQLAKRTVNNERCNEKEVREITLKLLSQETQTYRDKAGGCVYPCRRPRSWAGKDPAPPSPAGTSVGCWDSVSAGTGNDLLSVGRHWQQKQTGLKKNNNKRVDWPVQGQVKRTTLIVGKRVKQIQGILMQAHELHHSKYLQDTRAKIAWIGK